jgi:hypothetical protein
MTEQIDHPVADWPTMVTAIPEGFPGAAASAGTESATAGGLTTPLAPVPLVSAAGGPSTLVSSPAPMATPAATVMEAVTCPECGTLATVAVRRRESNDFCRTCDYPLFWIPSRIQLDSDDDLGDGSLRRLPGTVGKATVASVACPHCDEPNGVAAQLCVRCGLTMRPVALPPAPEIVYIPAPAPEPVIVQQKAHVPWWVWVLVFIVLSGSIALLTFPMLKEFN